MPSSFLKRELIEHIRLQFVPDWNGIHGVSHWARVRTNGRRLARQTNANEKVVELFSYLHDSRRLEDGYDLEHGPRAAEWLVQLNGVFFDLEEDELRLLTIACRDHSKGETKGDITVLTCWDADRLDLGRIGVKPHRDYLCTDIGRDPETIQWAYARSLAAINQNMWDNW